jgi:hypothetical protein
MVWNSDAASSHIKWATFGMVGESPPPGEDSSSAWLEKISRNRLIKNGQMQGTRNPEE